MMWLTGGAAAMSKHTIVLIPGDGIGPEVSAAMKRVLDAAGHGCRMGRAARRRDGPRAGVRQRPARTHAGRHPGAQGRAQGPGDDAGRQGVQERQRPAPPEAQPLRRRPPGHHLPGVKTRFDNVDLVIVRENTEGLYSGIENEVVPGVVTSLKVATTQACTRIARYAFRYATRNRRRKITVFHKANIMKLTDGMFLNASRKIHEEEYPNIEYEEVIIDAGCMKLVQNPTRFDVLLMENLYGDLVSDLCAGLVGGLGVVPGGEHRRRRGRLRSRARLRARHRRQGRRQSAGLHHDRRDDAPAHPRGRRGGENQQGLRRGPGRGQNADRRPRRQGDHADVRRRGDRQALSVCFF